MRQGLFAADGLLTAAPMYCILMMAGKSSRKERSARTKDKVLTPWALTRSSITDAIEGPFRFQLTGIQMKPKWVIIVAAGLTILLAFVGPGVYRRMFVAYHYRCILYGKRGDLTKHYRAVARYPDLTYELASQKLSLAPLRDASVCLAMLGEIGDSRSIALISRTMESNIFPEHCAMDLRNIGSQEALCALFRALDNTEPSVRNAAYISLLQTTRENDLMALLRKGLGDAADFVKATVLDELESLPQHHAGLKDQVRAIFESSTEETDLKEAAARVLVRMGDEGAMAFLLQDAKRNMEAGQPSIVREELRLLVEARGKGVVPDMIDLLREVPEKHNWPILDALGDIAGKTFYERAEAEAWWQEQESKRK